MSANLGVFLYIYNNLLINNKIMENKPVTIKSIAYKYGAIAGLISAAFSLMIWAMDMTYSESIVKDYFGMAVMLVCIVLAILNFKKIMMDF